MARRKLPYVPGFVVALLLACLPTHAARLVSVNAAGTASGNGASFDADLSANGRYVAFVSSATDLTSGGTSPSPLTSVYVRDLLTGVTVLASVNVAPHLGSASRPRLSAEGRYVAYSRETCTIPTLCPTRDVFVRDLAQGITTLVSVNLDGTPANGFGQVLSADGRYVAFLSNSGNIVPNDSNGATDVFVRDLWNGTTQLGSVNASGTGSGNAGIALSTPLYLSEDARFLAFTSEAGDLVANDGNGAPDAFLRDLVSGTTRLVSVNGPGTQSANDSSYAMGISGDGRRVLFSSSATDLVSVPDPNTAPDLFVRDFGTGATQLVSINSTGTGTGSFSSGPAVITSDGRFVAFSSMANDLVPEDSNARRDIFLRDLQTGATRLVSGGNQGSGGDESEISGSRAVSEDGRFVIFQSSDPTLVTGVTYPCPFTPCYQTFLRDLQTGTLSLLSVSPDGTMAGDDGDFPSGGSLAQVSPDGRVIVFQSPASNLATVPDTNDVADLFVVGMPAGIAAAEVPVLGKTGLVLLTLLIAAGGALRLRRL